MNKFKGTLIILLCLCFVYTCLPQESQATVHGYFWNAFVKGKLLLSPAERDTDSGGTAYFLEVNDLGTVDNAEVSGKGRMAGTAAEKTYALGINVNRPSTSVATGDSNDAALKIDFRNYADNDTNYIQRGINSTVSNRTNGEVGKIENVISTQNKVGNAPAINTLAPYCTGLLVDVSNYGLVTTEFIGLDVNLRNEGTVATTEAGIRIRNTNASIADAVGSAILITDTGANTGFDNLIDASGASVVQAEIVTSSGAKIFSGSAANGDAVYAEVGAYDAVGSIYLSTAAGAIYVQVANAGAATDWFKCTSTDAD